MANINAAGFLKHSDGSSLDAYPGITATFNTEWMDVPECDSIGVYAKCVNTSGSSATMVGTLELTPDSGTTTLLFPDVFNAATQATLADIAVDDDTGKAFEFWENPIPALAGWQWRVVFTVGGTAGTNVVTAKFVTKTTGR